LVLGVGFKACLLKELEVVTVVVLRENKMSQFNASDFNSNPACFGVGPTQGATNPYSMGQFVSFMIFSALMVLTAVATLYMRKWRRRLRVRTPAPIFISSFGGMVIILIRISYDLIGRQYFPCSWNLTLFYFML